MRVLGREVEALEALLRQLREKENVDASNAESTLLQIESRVHNIEEKITKIDSRSLETCSQVSVLANDTKRYPTRFESIETLLDSMKQMMKANEEGDVEMKLALDANKAAVAKQKEILEEIQMEAQRNGGASTAEVTALRLKVGGALEEMRSTLESRMDVLESAVANDKAVLSGVEGEIKEVLTTIGLLEDDVKSYQKWTETEQASAGVSSSLCVAPLQPGKGYASLR